MRILLLAPEPFYQERGTPLAVDLVLRTLSARGEQVDALVYHEGEDVAYPGVTIQRIPQIPGLSRIGPGPSWKKLACDLVFFGCALRLAAPWLSFTKDQRRPPPAPGPGPSGPTAHDTPSDLNHQGPHSINSVAL